MEWICIVRIAMQNFGKENCGKILKKSKIILAINVVKKVFFYFFFSIIIIFYSFSFELCFFSINRVSLFYLFIFFCIRVLSVLLKISKSTCWLIPQLLCVFTSKLFQQTSTSAKTIEEARSY